MTPATLRLHRAALTSGDRAVWPGTRFVVSPAGVAVIDTPPVIWPAPVSLVPPMEERQQ